MVTVFLVGEGLPRSGAQLGTMSREDVKGTVPLTCTQYVLVLSGVATSMRDALVA